MNTPVVVSGLYQAIQRIARREMGVPFDIDPATLVASYHAENRALRDRGETPTLEEIVLILIHG